MFDFKKLLHNKSGPKPKHQPPTTTPKKPKALELQQQSDNPKTPVNNIIDSNLYVVEYENNNPRAKAPKDYNFSAAGPLTNQETLFLENYFSGDHNIESAMLAAGYGNYSSAGYRNVLAKKIIKKHESAGGDAAKLMRDMGYGEVRVIGLLVEAATGFRSETVKLQARIALAKILGLTEQSAGSNVYQGVQIVIKTDKLGTEDKPIPEIAVTTEQGPALPATTGPGFRVIK